jgi:hypothetical protein
VGSITELARAAVLQHQTFGATLTGFGLIQPHCGEKSVLNISLPALITGGVSRDRSPDTYRCGLRHVKYLTYADKDTENFHTLDNARKNGRKLPL